MCLRYRAVPTGSIHVPSAALSHRCEHYGLGSIVRSCMLSCMSASFLEDGTNDEGMVEAAGYRWYKTNASCFEMQQHPLQCYRYLSTLSSSSASLPLSSSSSLDVRGITSLQDPWDCPSSEMPTSCRKVMSGCSTANGVVNTVRQQPHLSPRT